ncbi:MFS_MosC_like domain containing protein [Candidatus Nanopelagicaceae bacterium]
MSQLRQYSRARIAITTAFIINGTTAGAFYARVPDFKRELGVTNSALGFALLCIAIGVLIGLGFSGRQSAKRGSAPVTHYATYALGLSLLLVGPVLNYATLCLAFVVFGACLSTQDVAMNSHAIVLEHEAGKRYMSTFHAMFSAGALFGGVLGGFLAQQEKTIMWQCAFLTMVIFIANFSVRNMFLPADLDKHPLEGKKKIKKPKLFLIVGLLGTCAAIGEGSAGDWGAILARDTFDATPFVSTLPYICFSAAMVIGRLFGDRAASKYGPMNLIVGGGLIAGIGLGGGLLVGGIGGVIFGWLAAGIGLSTVIPMLFSQAGEIAKTRFEGQFAPSEGVAMVSGIAYFGFLVGPPTLGFLGDAVGLRWAMLVPAVLALVMALGSRPVLSNR